MSMVCLNARYENTPRNKVRDLILAIYSHLTPKTKTISGETEINILPVLEKIKRMAEDPQNNFQ